MMRRKALSKKENFLFTVARGCRKMVMRNWKPEQSKMEWEEVLNRDEDPENWKVLGVEEESE